MSVQSGERWRRKNDGLEVETEVVGDTLRIRTVGRNPDEGAPIEEALLRNDYEPVNTSNEVEIPTYDRDALPEDFTAPGGHSWAEFGLKQPLRAIKIDGPFQVRLPLDHALRHEVGATTCNNGWLAIDHKGDPFPILEEDFLSIYAPAAGSGGVTMKPTGAIFARLAEYVEKQGGSIALNYDLGTEEWNVSVVFGQEAGDSPMAGGAAHGVNGDLETALGQAAEDCGLRS